MAGRGLGVGWWCRAGRPRGRERERASSGAPVPGTADRLPRRERSRLRRRARRWQEIGALDKFAPNHWVGLPPAARTRGRGARPWDGRGQGRPTVGRAREGALRLAPWAPNLGRQCLRGRARARSSRIGASGRWSVDCAPPPFESSVIFQSPDDAAGSPPAACAAAHVHCSTRGGRERVACSPGVAALAHGGGRSDGCCGAHPPSTVCPGIFPHGGARRGHGGRRAVVLVSWHTGFFLAPGMQCRATV